MLSPGSANTFDEAKLRTPGNNGVRVDQEPATGFFYAGIKDWAQTQIAAACAADPNKPVFVMLHHPIANTVLRSDDSGTATFGVAEAAWFKDYPQVVIFAGHIHTPNNDPRSIWQGGSPGSPGYTVVNTVSTHYQNMDVPVDGSWSDYSEIDTSENPSDNGRIEFIGQTRVWNIAGAQGMIVKVRGSEVTIENYDFDVSELSPTPLSSVVQLTEQTWRFDVANPGSFPYTRAVRDAQKQAPVFVAGAAGPAIPDKVTVKAKTANSVTVEFDQAALPEPGSAENPGRERVHSYRFDFYTGGTLVKQVKTWSDFMLTPRLRKPRFEQRIDGLRPGTEYTLRIYAYGSFQVCSTQYLTGNFTTN
jgi:hypothetical protein